MTPCEFLRNTQRFGRLFDYMATTQHRKRKKKHPVKRFLRKHFALCMTVMVLIFVALIVLIIYAFKNDSKTPGKAKTTPTPTKGATTAVTPTEPGNKQTPTDSPTGSAENPTDPPTPTVTPTEAPTSTPTPTPTPTAFGECSSVTTDLDAEPIEMDNWPIDYLMLVNWTHRLKYTGDPEGLVRLDEVLDRNVYIIQDPISVPEKDRDYVIVDDRDNYSRGNRVALEALNRMCTDARAAGCSQVKISQTGAYRNYATQNQFWINRITKEPNYGKDPYKNPTRTGPGNASEHRTGLGFDIWLIEYDYKWMHTNCWKYGFILRYPEKKTKVTGIQYEQWHFRYVGEEAAAEMHELGYCLEEYIAYKNGEDVAALKH